MSATATSIDPHRDARPPEHVDVLIVGAGISGIGTAYHLQSRHPGKSYAILEGREALGGTWDLFRYPGIRSDSDLPTLGYKFKPWTGDAALADGPAILDYIEETAVENGIDRRIRFGHHVKSASWSTEEGRWTVVAERVADGESVTVTCGWLFGACGYYRYDQGYTPEFEGRERFRGEIVHPQHWPEDLDYAGKRVLVIGSGATAVTIVPVIAERAEQVTMLQRSPSYVISIPSKDAIANLMRRWFGDERGHRLARRKNIWMQRTIFRTSRRRPRLIRRLIRALQRRQLPDDYPIDPHFNPDYDPWDQRLCLVPDGDLFRAISDGSVEVVTDRIETFTETGVQLQSGAELEAEIIVTATGLDLLAFGGIELCVDGEDVVLSETTAYRGMMLSNVPNFAFAIGYTNASWTLKVDLTGEYFCRLLDYMHSEGVDQCVPVPGPDLQRRPLLDFDAGYVQRSIDRFPRQGDRGPWQLSMDYDADARSLGADPVNDGAVRFSRTVGAVDRRELEPVG